MYLWCVFIAYYTLLCDYAIMCFQLNISYPATGCQKLIEVDDEKKLRAFYEKRMAQEVSAESLGDEWKVRDIV